MHLQAASTLTIVTNSLACFLLATVFVLIFYTYLFVIVTHSHISIATALVREVLTRHREAHAAAHANAVHQSHEGFWERRELKVKLPIISDIFSATQVLCIVHTLPLCVTGETSTKAVARQGT